MGQPTISVVSKLERVDESNRRVRFGTLIIGMFLNNSTEKGIERISRQNSVQECLTMW